MTALCRGRSAFLSRKKGPRPFCRRRLTSAWCPAWPPTRQAGALAMARAITTPFCPCCGRAAPPCCAVFPGSFLRVCPWRGTTCACRWWPPSRACGVFPSMYSKKQGLPCPIKIFPPVANANVVIRFSQKAIIYNRLMVWQFIENPFLFMKEGAPLIITGRLPLLRMVFIIPEAN